MATTQELMDLWTKAEMRDMLSQRGRSIPRGSTKRDLAEMLSGEAGADHDSIFDCIEDDATRRRAYRRTGWDTVTHVSVLECSACGRRGAVETMYGDQPGDVHDYGYDSVESILADYGVE